VSSGGKRVGAGRKPGEAWAGKKKGVHRIGVRPAARVAIRRIIEGDVNPVQILLGIASDEGNSVDIRVAAAAHACPYCFPRLSSAVVNANHVVTKVDARELIDRLAERIGRLAPPAPPIIDQTIDAADDDPMPAGIVDDDEQVAA
jgi:hypothetical protein